MIAEAQLRVRTYDPDRLKLQANPFAHAVFARYRACNTPIGIRGHVLLTDFEFPRPILFFGSGIERGKEDDTIGKRFWLSWQIRVIRKEDDIIDEQVVTLVVSRLA